MSRVSRSSKGCGKERGLGERKMDGRRVVEIVGISIRQPYGQAK